MFEMMENIRFKIKKFTKEVSLPVMDPFRSDSVLLPLAENKRAENF